jgi:hypothetical protein
MRSLIARIAEIEARIGMIETPTSPITDIASMSDAECVDQWRRLCHRPTPKPKPYPPAEEAAIVAAWWAMKES